MSLLSSRSARVAVDAGPPGRNISFLLFAYPGGSPRSPLAPMESILQPDRASPRARSRVSGEPRRAPRVMPRTDGEAIHGLPSLARQAQAIADPTLGGLSSQGNE